jgi:glycosyltransferase involved in cell wall biosynthesis
VLERAQSIGVPVTVDATDGELSAAYRSAKFIVQVPVRSRDPKLAPPELLGLTLLEGMASGCVPICPSTGPAAEFVRDGVEGFCYAAEDMNDLRHTLAKAVTSERLDHLATAARAESRRWTWEEAGRNVLRALGPWP